MYLLPLLLLPLLLLLLVVLLQVPPRARPATRSMHIVVQILLYRHVTWSCLTRAPMLAAGGCPFVVRSQWCSKREHLCSPLWRATGAGDSAGDRAARGAARAPEVLAGGHRAPLRRSKRRREVRACVPAD
jgi:hypothetical protein